MVAAAERAAEEGRSAEAGQSRAAATGGAAAILGGSLGRGCRRVPLQTALNSWLARRCVGCVWLACWLTDSEGEQSKAKRRLLAVVAANTTPDSAHSTSDDDGERQHTERRCLLRRRTNFRKRRSSSRRRMLNPSPCVVRVVGLRFISCGESPAADRSHRRKCARRPAQAAVAAGSEWSRHAVARSD